VGTARETPRARLATRRECAAGAEGAALADEDLRVNNMESPDDEAAVAHDQRQSRRERAQGAQRPAQQFGARQTRAVW
jgi:hypothetical protein